MSEETRRVLEMLSEGKVSVDEAERLISAIGEGQGRRGREAEGAGPLKQRSPRYLRVIVDEGEQKVNVRVPMKLIRAGVKLQALLPEQARAQIDRALAEKGIDPKKLRPEDVEELVEALDELTVDVDGGEGKKVRVFCE